MGEGEANPEWDEIAENTGLDHEQVGFASASFRFFCLTFIEFCKTAELLVELHEMTHWLKACNSKFQLFVSSNLNLQLQQMSSFNFPDRLFEEGI